MTTNRDDQVPATPPAKAKKAKKPKKENLGFWRENTEALTVAVMMALTVKLFAVEAFKVPTESMEPTIVGRADGGDRLIVNKFVYQLRDPERFEIIVFQYPLNTLINYVKRAVGMPSEWLFLRNGDVYTAPYDLDHDEALAAATIQRKPWNVQRGLLERGQIIPPDARDVSSFGDYWLKEDGERGLGQIAPLADEDHVVFRAEKGLTLVRFTRPDLTSMSGQRPVISNMRFDDWTPVAPKPGFFASLFGAPSPSVGSIPPFDGADEVGDMRMQFEVRPEAKSGAAVVEIRDGTHGDPIVVRIAVDDGGEKSALLFRGESIAIDAAIEVDSWTEVAVTNVDDMIRVEVDGDLVLEHPYTHDFIEPTIRVLAESETEAPKVANTNPRPAQATHDLPHDNALFFGFDGARALFRDLEAARDTYYTVSGATEFHIPEDSYLMLGDNSPSSLDARAWKKTVLSYRGEDGEVETLWGDAEGVTDAPTRPEENPFERDGRLYFIDHFGNEFEIERDRVIDQRTFYDHFVHRRYVLGRAYFTFWPLMQIGPIR